VPRVLDVERLGLQKLATGQQHAAVCTECMARPRSASGFLRLSLDQSALMYPAPEHSLWP
jgi:hypothetical protein